MPPEPTQNQFFRIERHGRIAVVIPAAEVETLSENTMQQAGRKIVAQLKADPPAALVIDLAPVYYFGSVFLSFLFLCYLPLKKHGTEVVLAGASERALELLRLTNLESLWALHDSRESALQALGGA
jgi:anti-anti-sigma factor